MLFPGGRHEIRRRPTGLGCADGSLPNCRPSHHGALRNMQPRVRRGAECFDDLMTAAGPVQWVTCGVGACDQLRLGKGRGRSRGTGGRRPKKPAGSARMTGNRGSPLANDPLCGGNLVRTGAYSPTGLLLRDRTRVRLSPEDVAGLLNEHLTAMTGAVLRCGVVARASSAWRPGRNPVPDKAISRWGLSLVADHEMPSEKCSLS